MEGPLLPWRNWTFCSPNSEFYMRKLIIPVSLAALISLLPAGATWAEVAVTIDHNENVAVSKDFRFKIVPAPRQNAAVEAAFEMLDGEQDGNSAAPGVLHDNRVASEEDEPESNFFFEEGTDGGRLLVDLGKVIPIKEIDTYSWHPDTRAPQVYKLYGSDGADPGFVAKPRRPQDPARAGWRLLADVDTRRKFGVSGGQYGVALTDAAGLVGSCRYLLFDVSRTEDDDSFGNTFYTEIDVVDRDAPANPAPARSAWESSTYEEKGIRLTFESNDFSFDPKIRDRLVHAFFVVYPREAAEFNHDAPKDAVIAVDTSYGGLAETMDRTIRLSADWFRKNPEEVDVLTHEAMHVVQQYGEGEPSWLTEGIADYARYKFGLSNATWSLPDYDPSQSYQDSYRVTARFLVWLDKHVKLGIVVVLDHMMREQGYTAEIWKQQTGKTVDELWQDYGKNPAL